MICCLSCRIFLCVFSVYCRIVRILCLLLYSAICWCVLVALVKLSVLAKWLATERPLWWHLHEVRRLSPQIPGGRACLCAFFFRVVCLCCYVFPPPGPTQYIFHTAVAWCSLGVLKVPLNTKQTTNIVLSYSTSYFTYWRNAITVQHVNELIFPRLQVTMYRYNFLLCLRPHRADRGIKRCFCLASVCMTVAYIGPNSRTERPRKTKIGTEVAYVTRLGYHFQGPKVNLLLMS